MFLGIIKDNAVIGRSIEAVTIPKDNLEHDVWNWYSGDLDSGEISPLWSYSEYVAGRASSPRMQSSWWLARWYWEHDSYWFAFESLFGPVGPHGSSLWRSDSSAKPAPVDTADEPEAPIPRFPQREPKIVTETLPLETKDYGEGETFVRLSSLEPLMLDTDAKVFEGKLITRDFCHLEDGFDFIPQSRNRWTLFMTIEHTMQVWECRSERVTTSDGEQVRNTWKLEYEFWVPWRGQFFIVRITNPDEPPGHYVLVRDTGEVHMLRIDPHRHLAGVPGRERDKRGENFHWLGYPLLDPVDYLIALIYIEPQNAVYGFGPNFYVRLDDPDSGPKLQRCRNLTRGKATWTDADGNPHELQDPFRTLWQCAQVLKEEGVLDAVRKEEETKPKK